MLNLQQFSISGKKMTLEEAQDQLRATKRLADLKAAEEKSKRSLEKINIQAQATKIAEYEAKRAKILAEYNHYITFRANQGRITKINYRIDKVTKDETKRIESDNQPLSLTVMQKFRLKQLGISEWIQIQALVSKEVFVTEDIRVDEMHRNLIPPPGVVASKGLVITEPEAGIFYYNGNFDYVFQRENEFHLASTPQLIRLLNDIQRNSLEAEEMYKNLELIIEARNDVNQARKIVKDNLDGGGIFAEYKASADDEDQLSAKYQLVIKGFVDGKASASNLKDIQVKDIVKEVEDYLKTYSSAEIDIRWYVEGIL
ncbi:hypothetical protein Tco_1537432 [Tanacetum coccineum]